MVIRPARGFTLIELLVVMSIIAILITIAVPRYMHSVDKAREAVLRENLSTVRKAIDQFYGDTGRYPANLEELVQRRYLRGLPYDPVTESRSTWGVVMKSTEGTDGLYDIRSGAQGRSRDGTFYSSW